MLELFAAPTVNAQRAIIGLLESGLRHRLTRVDLKAKSAALLKANHHGRVPTLVDPVGADGKPLCLDQSGAILLYLAEKSGHLMPGVPRERAECHRFLMLHANDLGPAFVSSYNVTRLGAPQELAAAHFRAATLRFCRMLDERLRRVPFLAGSEFSIADCAVYPDIPWCYADWPEVGRLRHLRRWMEAVGARPAVAKAMAWGQA